MIPQKATGLVKVFDTIYIQLLLHYIYDSNRRVGNLLPSVNYLIRIRQTNFGIEMNG